MIYDRFTKAELDWLETIARELCSDDDQAWANRHVSSVLGFHDRMSPEEREQHCDRLLSRRCWSR
jgi:hypothetical protein